VLGNALRQVFIVGYPDQDGPTLVLSGDDRTEGAVIEAGPATGAGTRRIEQQQRHQDRVEVDQFDWTVDEGFEDPPLPRSEICEGIHEAEDEGLTIDPRQRNPTTIGDMFPRQGVGLSSLCRIRADHLGPIDETGVIEHSVPLLVEMEASLRGEPGAAVESLLPQLGEVIEGGPHGGRLMGARRPTLGSIEPSP
jgi:hypothetical protein